MANKNRTWGQTRITINGNFIETAPKPTFRPGGVERSEVEADNRAGFYNEKPIGSSLECEVLATAGVSLKELQAIDDATVIVELDTGQSYVISHAYVADAVEATDGKIKLKIQGPEAEEMN